MGRAERPAARAVIFLVSYLSISAPAGMVRTTWTRVEMVRMLPQSMTLILWTSAAYRTQYGPVSELNKKARTCISA